MRTHYFARWSNSRYSNLRKIPSRIAVAVREDTTVPARKAVPEPYSTLPADATRPRCIRRIDVEHGNASRLRLVLDKALQLPPGPTVQAGSHAFTGLDPDSDMGQVLQHDRRTACFRGLANDRSANLVINVPCVAHLAARDAGQQLSCRPRAVALQTPTQRQKSIARISKRTSSKERSTTGCSRHVFSQINAQHASRIGAFNIGQIQNEMEVPTPVAVDEIGFLGDAAFKIAALETADAHLYPDPAIEGEQGDLVAFQQSIRALVEMDRTTSLAIRNYPVSSIGSVCLQASSDDSDGFTGHLRPEVGEPPAHFVIGQMMQANVIGRPRLNGNGRQQRTGLRKPRLQLAQLTSLVQRSLQPNRNCALHLCESTYSPCHTHGTLKTEQRDFGLNPRSPR